MQNPQMKIEIGQFYRTRAASWTGVCQIISIEQYPYEEIRAQTVWTMYDYESDEPIRNMITPDQCILRKFIIANATNPEIKEFLIRTRLV